MTISYYGSLSLVDDIELLLNKIQQDMYNKAESERNSRICVCDKIDEFVFAINNKHLCLVPWCECIECEDKIVTYCKKIGLNVKLLCIPFD